jgi:hypothetical protein
VHDRQNHCSKEKVSQEPWYKMFSYSYCPPVLKKYKNYCQRYFIIQQKIFIFY